MCDLREMLTDIVRKQLDYSMLDGGKERGREFREKEEGIAYLAGLRVRKRE